MKNVKNRPSNAAKLRANAEAKLKEKQRESALPVTESDKEKLVHELQVHQIELEMQNQELHEAREKTETTLNKYTELYDFAPVGYFNLDLQGEICELNLNAAKLLGGERANLINHNFKLFISQNTRPVFNNFFQKVFESDAKASCEVILGNSSNPPLYVYIEGIVFDEGQKCLAAVIDITERKKAEVKLKKSLGEKEILLRELHHRVKNNMQVISSLLRLQSATLDSKKAVAVFRECQNRIKAMALIHEKFYRSQDLSNINFETYVRDLVDTLAQSYDVSQNKVTVDINIKNVSLEIDTAISCGMIINELISNSLKHAFPQGAKRNIGVSILPAEGNHVEMIISDNGLGIPAELDFRKTDTLGLQLVNTLVNDQLDGKIELDRTAGTKFKITFEKKGAYNEQQKTNPDS
jgi:PAS domain S-box-containing protein